MIIGVGVLVAAGFAVAALVFGLRGVEVASWVAGIASLVVAVAAIVLAPPGSTAPAPPPGSSSSASGSRSVSVAGDAHGIISTGDHTTNTQHR